MTRKSSRIDGVFAASVAPNRQYSSYLLLLCSVAMAPSSSPQTCRWVFTLNNYTRATNYKRLFEQAEHKVKRAILGYEQGEVNGHPHIQGYVEFQRSVRLCNVRKVLSNAHWEGARGSAAQNFEYCTKSGRYDLVGNFSREMNGENTGNAPGPRPASVPHVIAGLLDSELSPQVSVSKEYADRHAFYDKAVNLVSNLKVRNKLFDQWKEFKLRMWQFEVLELALAQNDRKILWVTDPDGNHGKSYLARYMNILYGFQWLDGIVSTRDFAPMVDRNLKGVVFDVCRANEKKFDFSTLESIKNGFIVSGKYGGQSIWLESKPVVVFANYTPDKSLLSRDRWQIIDFGDENCSYDYTSTNAIVTPAVIHPFVRPPPVPVLTENFDLRSFVEANSTDFKLVGECIFVLFYLRMIFEKYTYLFNFTQLALRYDI